MTAVITNVVRTDVSLTVYYRFEDGHETQLQYPSNVTVATVKADIVQQLQDRVAAEARQKSLAGQLIGKTIDETGKVT